MCDPALARRVRLLGFDVDGVLTDNAVFIGAVAGERVEFKRFDIQDGLGHVLLRGTGIEVVWVSGRESDATTLRGQELKVSEVLQVSATRKVPAIERLLAERGLGWEDMAFVGDDLADLPVFRKVGFPIAVANARADLKALAKWTTKASGGHGAVREVIDELLQARGEYDAALARYFGEVEVPS